MPLYRGQVSPNPLNRHAVRARYGVFIVSLMFDLRSAIFIAVLNVISWQIWPRYHGTRLYIKYICESLVGIILCVHPANERRRYIITSSLIGWAHTQIGPCSELGHHLQCTLAPEVPRDLLKRSRSILNGTVWSKVVCIIWYYYACHQILEEILKVVVTVPTQWPVTVRYKGICRYNNSQDLGKKSKVWIMVCGPTQSLKIHYALIMKWTWRRHRYSIQWEFFQTLEI